MALGGSVGSVRASALGSLAFSCSSNDTNVLNLCATIHDSPSVRSTLIM